MKRQYRLVHIGVAAAIAAATVTAIGLVHEVGASGSGTASVYVPIVPCRLVDTRAGSDNVGGRNTPLQPAEVATFAVWGTNGNCTIPSSASGIATNATAVHPTADSYVTIYPADADPRPTASNLNVVAQQPPTPNQVTVGLSAAGAISAYNNGGTLDLVIDIVGYYQAPDSYTRAEIDTVVAGINAAVATKQTKLTGSRTAIYPGPGFAAEGNWTFGIDDDGVFPTAFGCFGERVELPDGATMAFLVSRMEDTSASSGVDVLFGRMTPATGSATLAEVSTQISGTPGVVTTAAPPFQPVTINNQVNAYFLQFCGGKNTAFDYAEIIYNLP